MKLLYILVDYDSDVILKANKINRNGNVYIKFEKMKITIGIGKSNINLSNLFGSDPVLGKFKYKFLYYTILVQSFSELSPVIF